VAREHNPVGWGVSGRIKSVPVAVAESQGPVPAVDATPETPWLFGVSALLFVVESMGTARERLDGGDDVKRGALVRQWLEFTLEHVIPPVYTFIMTPQAAQRATARSVLAVLDSAMSKTCLGDALLGSGVSWVDLLVASVLEALCASSALLSEFPTLQSWFVRFQCRPLFIAGTALIASATAEAMSVQPSAPPAQTISLSPLAVPSRKPAAHLQLEAGGPRSSPPVLVASPTAASLSSPVASGSTSTRALVTRPLPLAVSTVPSQPRNKACQIIGWTVLMVLAVIGLIIGVATGTSSKSTKRISTAAVLTIVGFVSVGLAVLLLAVVEFFLDRRHRSTRCLSSLRGRTYTVLWDGVVGVAFAGTLAHVLSAAVVVVRRHHRPWPSSLAHSD
jgi:glutathione S-transferase